MQLSRFITLLFQGLTVILAIALLLVFLYSGRKADDGGVVQIVEAPNRPVEHTKGSTTLSYAQAVDRAAPAVVNIYTTKIITQRSSPFLDDPLYRYFFGDGGQRNWQRREPSLGSGVVVSKQGHVVTNHHVIEGADEIAVALHDGRHTKARIVGLDPESDLAVLQLEIHDVPSITFGHSDQLRVGDVVLAIGNPYGVGQTVTSGIVSALGRSSLGVTTFEDFIQTDAAINPGNSGGALINAHGELVGINTVIFTESGGSHGIGFAIPTSLAKDVLTQLIEKGHVVRGWLGIGIQDLSEELAESFQLKDTRGAIITHVMPGSPAEKAGLERGDIITQINDVRINDFREALSQISRQQPGSEITLSLRRNGEKLEKKSKIAERPQQEARKRRR